MAKYMKITFPSAVICWLAVVLTFRILERTGADSGIIAIVILLFSLAAICLSLVFTALLAAYIFQRICPRVSSYIVFAAVIAISGIVVLSYAIYDIVYETAFLHGLAGWGLLVYVMPLILAILFVERRVWKRNARVAD